MSKLSPFPCLCGKIPDVVPSVPYSDKQHRDAATFEEVTG